jgi:hypothetical protein
MELSLSLFGLPLIDLHFDLPFPEKRQPPSGPKGGISILTDGDGTQFVSCSDGVFELQVDGDDDECGDDCDCEDKVPFGFTAIGPPLEHKRQGHGAS